MKSPHEWLESDLASLIQNQTKESIGLDYKRSESLQNTDRKKAELSKDVSAFANSAGGALVYGIEEDGYIPTGFDGGCDPAVTTKEWIEQIVNSTIHPRIDGVLINQVDLATVSPGKVAYVIEIPQSARGPHQAADKRYYKRFNFESVPMEDYEIKDVMRRVSSPVLRCGFLMEYRGELVEEIHQDPRRVDVPLTLSITNTAPTPAYYAVVKIYVDAQLRVMPASDTVDRGVWDIDFMGKRMHVLQAAWSTPDKMPLIQDITFNLINGTITIAAQERFVVAVEEFGLGWGIHAPEMSVTRGTARLELISKTGTK